MKKFTRFILGTALFYFVFSFAALYFFIVNDLCLVADGVVDFHSDFCSRQYCVTEVS